ncbi:Hypothetical protein PHPALM_36373 [Phytophthora palmivora]|uniref:HAT C-terminal dimerisation domain-containing protein n=1 Tax=Phytophthora palmivora TaxID=4796 RepID=A0A2P4X062_9STRA|nr:Hypothetical protein PHPALM_36373 [Phytophthora palmivora]
MDISFLDPTDTPRTSTDLVEAMVELDHPNVPGEESERRSRTLVQVSTEHHRSYMHHHMFGPDTLRAKPTDLGTECKKEFAHYLESISAVNGHNCPNLGRHSRKWLGSVATSVPSKRAISISDNIITMKRSSLKPNMVLLTVSLPNPFPEQQSVPHTTLTSLTPLSDLMGYPKLYHSLIPYTSP